MPHQCTDCGRRFDDGSKEMLSGCPNCGGNKFQYLPASAAEPSEPGQNAESTSDPRAERATPGKSESSVARTVGNAATAVRDFVGGSSGSDGQPSADTGSGNVPGSRRDKPAASETRPTSREPERTAGSAVEEDAAQASARSELVSREELPAASELETGWEQTTPGPQTRAEETDTDDATASEDSPATDRPDLSELRAELNEQFESIKVVEPGQYELNLMELYDRQEYIIALQEDGKYTVQVPEHWQD